MTTETTNEQSGVNDTNSKPGWKLVTLRIPPTMHHEITVLAGQLQFSRGKNVSVNALINEAVEQFIKRHKNPKMLKDFEGL